MHTPFHHKPLVFFVSAALFGSALILPGCNSSSDSNTATTGVTSAESLKRFATVPLGAEVTGMYITEAGDFFYNAQHPSSSNYYPNNNATTGVLTGQDMNRLADDFAPLAVPVSDVDKQSFMTAVGHYQAVAAQGDTFSGDLPFGLGAIVSADGTNIIAYSDDPDFNAFIPTNAEFSEGYLFTNWEYRPGGMSRLHLSKGSSGNWSVLNAMNVDFSTVGGTWVNCFGTLSPWNTPLTSEELYFDDTALWNEGSDSGVINLTGYLGYPIDGSGAWPNPYRYGYIGEITNPTTTPVPEKRFALGRFSHENAVVMPDRKTVYLSDDGSNVVFFKFVADVAGDLSAGTLYAAQVTQDIGVTDPALAGFDITWIELARGDEAIIAGWIADYDAVTVADYVSGATSYITDEEVVTWAAGSAADDRVAFLEARKAAAAKGATAEFNKMEGVNINYARAADGTVPYMVMAMSDISGGMSDTVGDIQLSANRCGVVYRMMLDTTTWDTTRMEPLVAGGPYDAAASVNQCATDNIANPDNVLILNDGRVVIGEDSSKHENNMIWIYTPGN